MAEFKLDQRYMVIKHTDVFALPDHDQIVVRQLIEVLGGILDRNQSPMRECLVLESDWPEYQPALKALEDRVNAEVHE